MLKPIVKSLNEMNELLSHWRNFSFFKKSSTSGCTPLGPKRNRNGNKDQTAEFGY